MVPRVLLTTCLLLGVSITAARAQPSSDPASDQPDSRVDRLVAFAKRHMPDVDQDDGIHLTRHFAVVFGDIKPGEGVAAGVALSDQFENGGFAQVKTEYSTRRFSLAQFRYDSPKWAGERLSFTTRARWQDAPALDLYGLGARSSIGRVDYSERRTEVSATGVVRLTGRVRVEAGAGAERYVTDGGDLLPPTEEALPTVPPLPGIGARTWFERMSIRAIGDWRAPEHEYPHSGTIVSAGADDYRDWQHHAFSFLALNGTAEHLVPTFGGRGVADVTATAWTTSPAAGERVPFFLMPTLGGGDYLEGYRLYRFRDRDAALLRGEYRWAVQRFLDVAGVYEIGAVAPSPAAFRAGDVKQSIGAGIRVHTASALVFTFDVARSREGFEVNINFSAPR